MGHLPRRKRKQQSAGREISTNAGLNKVQIGHDRQNDRPRPASRNGKAVSHRQEKHRPIHRPIMYERRRRPAQALTCHESGCFLMSVRRVAGQTTASRTAASQPYLLQQLPVWGLRMKELSLPARERRHSLATESTGFTSKSLGQWRRSSSSITRAGIW